MSTTLAEIKYQLGHADVIFRGTDFDGNGEGDNIGFEISRITIFTSAQSSDNKVGDADMDASAYLEAISEYNHDMYCLAVAFTYREFDDGVVGLAWVASSDLFGPVGGICQKRVLDSSGKIRSYNTAMVTLLNHGERLPSYKAALVLTHELGHSFGSPHDQASDSACAPDGTFGNYIMFPYTSSGGLANNDLFSSCSINSIYPVILNKGNCFIERTGPYCGNGITEVGEECDCGNTATCPYTDDCCTPSDAVISDPPCTFRRSAGKMCSPREAPCCTPTCEVMAALSLVCGQRSECLQETKCDGSQSKCPDPVLMPNDTMCDAGRKVCRDGICYRSICEKYALTQCHCDTQFEECNLCCQNSSDCLPAHNFDIFAPNGHTLLLTPGEPCSDQSGFCDISGKCIMGNHDSAMSRLKNAFSDEAADDVKSWLRNHWYYVLIGIVTIIVLTIIFVASKRKKDNVQSHARRMGRFERVLANASVEKQRQVRLSEDLVRLYNEKIERVKVGQVSREFTNAVARLAMFFPTVDYEVLTSVARQSSSESVAVRMLLIRGFPLRQVVTSPDFSDDEQET